MEHISFDGGLIHRLTHRRHFLRLEPWGHYSFFRSFVTIPFLNQDPKALNVVQYILESCLLRREKTMRDRDGKLIVDLPPKTVSYNTSFLSYMTWPVILGKLFACVIAR